MDERTPRKEEDHQVGYMTLLANESGTIIEILERTGELKFAHLLDSGLPLFDLLHPDDIEPLRLNVDWCLSHLQRSVTVRVRFHRGAEWWVPVIVTLRSLAEDRIELRLERDDAAAARSAERQITQAVDFSQHGIIVSNQTQCFYVNTACARLQGFDSVAELIDSGRRNLSDGICPDDLPMVMEEVRQRIAGEKKVSQYEVRLMRRDGSFVWVEVRAALVRWNGQFASLSWFSDISERKQAEASLIEHRNAAEDANRSKSLFLANMSHELRTPLNAIIGFSQMIGGQMCGPINVRYADYARDIQSSGEHLLDLINGVLDLSKLEAGKHELNETGVDVEQLARECVTVIRPSIAAAKLKLVVEISIDLPLVRADARALKQVLLNFLSNAVKFTPSGGTVTLSAAIRSGELHVSVQDSGVGMSQADIDIAMQPFGQVHGNALIAREHKGTGLGLPISLELIKLHGGDIAIESARGNGSTFTARLPASRVIARQLEARCQSAS